MAVCTYLSIYVFICNSILYSVLLYKMLFVAVADTCWVSLDDLSADSDHLGEAHITPYLKHLGANICLLQEELLVGKRLRKPICQP